MRSSYSTRFSVAWDAPGGISPTNLRSRLSCPTSLLAAKPLACGLPLGVILANEKAAATIGPGMHGTTFGGNTLACRVALEFLDILEGLLPAIQQRGRVFPAQLAGLARRFRIHPGGARLWPVIGMELEVARQQIVLDAMAEGPLINCTHDTVLRFLPPYIITEKEIDLAVKTLGRVLKRVKA